jgi:hypothetical protein
MPSAADFGAGLVQTSVVNLRVAMRPTQLPRETVAGGVRVHHGAELSNCPRTIDWGFSN